MPKWRAHTWIYYLSVVATGLAVIGWNAYDLATNPTGELVWLWLLVPIAVMARLYIQLPGQLGRICPSGVFTLYSAVVFGPEETALLALVEALIVGWQQSSQVYTRLLYNATAIPLAAWIGAMGAQWFLDQPFLEAVEVAVVIKAFTAAILYFLCNLALILGIMLATGGLRAVAAAKGIMLWSWAPYAIGGVTAGLLGLADPKGSTVGVAVASLVLYMTWRTLDYYFTALAEKKAALEEKAEALEANEQLLGQKESLLKEVRETHLASLKTLAMVIEAKDPLTHGHGQRVEALVAVICQCMDMEEGEREALSVAALLHDVGKLGVPEYLLYPNRKLDPEDKLRLQSHARIGADILSNARLSPVVTQVIHHHHERWDGEGYPDRLAGERIPLGARIITLADTWDRLRNPRAGVGLSAVEAQSFLRREAGYSLDPMLVEMALADGGALLAASERVGVGFFERGAAESAVSGGVIRDLQSHHRETRAIFDLGEKLRATLKLGEVLRVTSEALMNFIPATSLLLFLPQVEGEGVELAHVEGPSPLDSGSFREEAWGSYFARFSGANAESVSRSSLAKALRVPGESLAAMTHFIPLPMGRQEMGFVAIWTEGAELEAQDLRTATTLAAQAAPVIANARSFDRYERESVTDSLTGMANGRQLRREGERLIREALAAGKGGVVVMVDLNGFKAINDILGHHEGDHLLVDIARLLLRSTRPGELAARNGGDEFVLVWPGTKSGEARSRLDIIFKEACAFWPEVWDHAKGTSAGVSSFPNEGRSLERLMKTADERMYLDKQAKKVRRFGT